MRVQDYWEQFSEKLRLLPTLLTWKTAQTAEREKVREFLLEVVKD